MSGLEKETINIENVKFYDAKDDHLGRMVIGWSANTGFGNLEIYKDKETGKLEAITEYMCDNKDKTFMKILLEKLFDTYKLNISVVPLCNPGSVTVEHLVITGSGGAMKPGVHIRYRHREITTQDNIMDLSQEMTIEDCDIKTKRFISAIIYRMLDMIDVIN